MQFASGTVGQGKLWCRFLPVIGFYSYGADGERGWWGRCRDMEHQLHNGFFQRLLVCAERDYFTLLGIPVEIWDLCHKVQDAFPLRDFPLRRKRLLSGAFSPQEQVCRTTAVLMHTPLPILPRLCPPTSGDCGKEIVNPNNRKAAGSYHVLSSHLNSYLYSD